MEDLLQSKKRLGGVLWKGFVFRGYIYHSWLKEQPLTATSCAHHDSKSGHSFVSSQAQRPTFPAFKEGIREGHGPNRLVGTRDISFRFVRSISRKYNNGQPLE